MRFDIISIFPEMFTSLTDYGISHKALNNQLYKINFWNPRNYALDVHGSVDARPYGGGPGMVMQAEILAKTTRAIVQEYQGQNYKTIYPTAQGKPVKQANIIDWMTTPNWIIICGRYEGIDQRFIDKYIDEEVAIGDIVVSGGELPAMMLMDTTIRQIAGALGNDLSLKQDSFMDGLLDCPHYTRPEVWEAKAVPKILLSGNHSAISKWRQEQQLNLTKKVRPDIYQNYQIAPKK